MSKIVILGGGFGGIRAALDVGKKLRGQAEITLIDRNSYHLFAPDLYEVASVFGMTNDPFSVRVRKTVSIPYSDIFENSGVEFVQAEVAQVDLFQKVITTKGDQVFPFDYLILALGSQAADFNISGVREYAYQFKTMEDALMLNSQLVMLYERAHRGGLELPIRVVVGGGGFTGVELAAELASTVRQLAKKFKLPTLHTIISLVEAGPRILPTISDRERKIITERLTKIGVVVRTNCAIEHIDAEKVTFKNGQHVKHQLLAWTAGVKPNDFLKTIQGLELTPTGKVVVDEHLNSASHKHVFAVGDIVEFIDHRTDRFEPALGYVAIQHGRVVARNIVRSIHGKELKNHKPFYDLWIAPVGGKYALAHLWFGVSISGFFGWVVRELVNLRYFLQILSVKKALRLLREEIEVFVKND